MKIHNLFLVFILFFGIGISGCGPKDASIKASIEEKLKAKEEAANTTVTVEKGETTLSGEVSSGNAKVEIENIVKSVKGVKSVVNNITVALPPAPAPVEISADEPLRRSVADAIKDNATVQASVENGVITLSGQIDKASLPKLMMKLNALNPKKITNNLTVK